ncbi:MAG: putative alpha/beta hydrolase family esterase [Aureispira sp.]|jgi:predicted alpha/beta hydrolase family esterase
MKVSKIYFKVMNILFPSILAKQVYQFMSNPRVKKLRAFEEKILDQAEQERIRFKTFDIQTYAWGNPKHKVALLVHGWEGQAGNFGAMIDILLAKNYYIIAFDGPSHGRSSKGNTNMFEFSELATVFLHKYKPTTIISHSFGSVTTMIAMSNNVDIPVKEWIAVTTPHDFKDRIEQISETLGVGTKTINKVVKMVESDMGVSIDSLNVKNYGSKIKHVENALIVHSKTDKVLPIESARIAHKEISQSQLIELDNLGHYSILWSDELKEIVINRLN